MQYGLKSTGRQNVASIFSIVSSQGGVAAVLFSFSFALLCSSHLVKNNPRGISLD